MRIRLGPSSRIQPRVGAPNQKDERPTKLESPAGSKAVLITFKRVKKE